MESPNRMALDLVDEAIDFADELRVGIRHLDNEGVVLDFGVACRGGVEAGLLLAEVATGGLATVGTRIGTVQGVGLTHVELATDHPELALAGCQRPEWALEAGGAVHRVGGPVQLLAGEAAGGPFTDDAEFAVCVLEADRHPDEDVIEASASAVGLPASAVFAVLAAPDSIAGSVAAAARAAERAVTGLAEAGFDPDGVLSATSSAPVAPLAPSADEARARSMAAVAGGARVHLVLDTDVEPPDRLRGEGEAVVPAQTTLDVVGGDTHVLGGVDEAALAADLGL